MSEPDIGVFVAETEVKGYYYSAEGERFKDRPEVFYDAVKYSVYSIQRCLRPDSCKCNECENDYETVKKSL